MVTCEIKHWNYFKIIPKLFYFTRNHDIVIGVQGRGLVGGQVTQNLKQFADIVYRFWLQKWSKFETVGLTDTLIIDQWGLIDICARACRRPTGERFSHVMYPRHGVLLAEQTRRAVKTLQRTVFLRCRCSHSTLKPTTNLSIDNYNSTQNIQRPLHFDVSATWSCIRQTNATLNSDILYCHASTPDFFLLFRADVSIPVFSVAPTNCINSVTFMKRSNTLYTMRRHENH